MEINVNPTRMEMQRLKKRLALSRRGWKLLKDKQDELMKTFREKKEGFLKKYTEISEKMKRILSLAAFGWGFLGEETNKLVEKSDAEILVASTLRKLFNVSSVNFTVEKKGRPLNYLKKESVSFWDDAVNDLDESFEEILVLGGLLFEIEDLCREISATRRRVNSLEYRIIPALTQTIKDINFRLEELARSNTVRIMKVRDIVRSH